MGIKEVQGQLSAMKSAPWTPEFGWTSEAPRIYSHGWLSMPRCSSTGTSWGRTAKQRTNASVGRSPRCLVLSSVRASIFGGLPCKVNSESSTASGRRDSPLDIGRKVASTWWPTARELSRRGLDQYGTTDGCVGCANSTIGGTGIPHSEECRRRIEKEMKNDPEQHERIQEIKRKRRDFIEREVQGRRECGGRTE